MPAFIHVTKAMVDASDKYGSDSVHSDHPSIVPRTVQDFYLTQEINRTSFSRSQPHRGRRFTITSRLTRKQISTRTDSDSKDVGVVSVQDVPSELEFNVVGDGYMTGIEEVDELWDEEKGSETQSGNRRSERTLPVKMVDIQTT